MDSRTRLEYALFQLTPTRTRCDLVVFSGNAKEKLASGLLEPFLSHLSSAKDQISKGGYSITLRPATNAAWFTKSTLERFVRFVSTPEVLERFVTIETEITQIESSVQSAGQINAPTETERIVLATDGNTKNSAISPKLKGDSGGANDAGHEEHSKVHLQRVLENRKAVLRKEQAMAYARALVAGFKMDYIDDLISFADAFGASRLREACINFMELCNKKNNDGRWMDEIAAIQAFSHLDLSYQGTSGIILAGEQNGSTDASASDSTLSHESLETNQDHSSPTTTQTQSTDGKAQMPMPWATHFPQYMQNFQGPMFQQRPPYQGYLYPGMQAPPYYTGNMPWRPNAEDSPDAEPYDDRNPKAFSRKEKLSHGKRQHASRKNVHTDPSDSSSASDSDEYEEQGKRNVSIEKQHTKKNGKRSSRKVVIRNINYIASKADGETEGNSSNEDGFIDEDSLKQQVEEAVGSLERHHKSSSHSNKKRGGSKHGNQYFEDVVANDYEGEKRTGSWDIFQNLLLRDADSASNGVDSQLQQVWEGKPSAFDVESEQVKEHRNVSTDSFIVAERVTGNKDKTRKENFEAGESVRPLIKRESGYEELLFPQRNESENSSRGVLSNYATESPIIKSQTEGDWFISNQPNKLASQDNYTAPFIEGHFQSGKSTKDVLVDDSFMIQSQPLDSQPRTDIFMVSDIVGVTQLQHSASDNIQDKVEASSGYEPDDLYMVIGRDAAAEQAVAPWDPEMEAEATKRHSDVELADCVEAKLPSQANGAPEGKVASKAAKPKGSVGSHQKSKPDVITRSKKPSVSRTMTPKSISEKEEEKRKRMEELLIQRQKRIAERSAASGVTPAISRSRSLKETKTSNASTKNEKPKGQAATQDAKKLNKPILGSSTLDRLSAARVTQNLSTTESKISQPRKSTSKENGVVGPSLSKKTAGSESKKLNANKVKLSDKKIVPKNSKASPSKDSKSATAALPIEIRTSKATETADGIDTSKNVKEVHSVSSVTKNVDMLGDNRCNTIPYNGDLPVDTEKVDDKGNPKESPVLHEDTAISNNRGEFDALPTSPSKDLNFATLEIVEDDMANKKFPVSQEISAVELSTPPPNEMSQEPNQSRKKWNSGDNSPRATKGLRKLLLFGRKSRNSP